MRSPPRCGKNILTDFIREHIIGRENFLSTTRLEDVMGRFNAAVRAKKLIILNECDMTGIDVKIIDDFAGYMILSNHAMPIRIEMGDERFVALNVSAKYKNNQEYFSSLVKVLEIQIQPELIKASIPNPQRFIQYYLEMMCPNNCDTLEIPCTNFHSTYQNWCSEKGENKTLSDNKFGMEIKQFIPKTRPRRSGA
ncbi:19927_t:CDS:2 [Rhizophagus irregularis]|nr:19927_t:CDS:2 [Rhizophagus irregularis]